MTSKEFETAAKLAVIARFKNAKDVYEMHTVWFARILGAMKCIVVDLDPANMDMYEVTYNAAKDEMYVDKYSKTDNLRLTREDIDLL
jgi:hypothetical protein